MAKEEESNLGSSSLLDDKFVLARQFEMREFKIIREDKGYRFRTGTVLTGQAGSGKSICLRNCAMYAKEMKYCVLYYGKCSRLMKETNQEAARLLLEEFLNWNDAEILNTTLGDELWHLLLTSLKNPDKADYVSVLEKCWNCFSTQTEVHTYIALDEWNCLTWDMNHIISKLFVHFCNLRSFMGKYLVAVTSSFEFHPGKQFRDSDYASFSFKLSKKTSYNIGSVLWEN